MPFLRNPTYAEVDELIAAKDATVKAIDDAAAKTLATWTGTDADDWRTQWKALVARYNTARAMRTSAKTASLAVPPEVVWGAILHALKQAWDPAGSLTQAPAETTGDLADLDRRLRAHGAAPNFAGVPQPVVPDQDLSLFQAADVVVTAAKTLFNLLPFALLVFLASRTSR